MPDDDELAFLRAIRESPDEDAPRLVFADWLDDCGQHERAEFIRVQCELEPIRFEVDRPRVRELLQRERELARDFGLDHPAWLETPINGQGGPLFRRGVPEIAAMALDVLSEHGKALLSSQPTIRELVVFNVYNVGAEKLAACPALEFADTLEVAEWLDETDFDVLLASPHVRSRRLIRFWTDSAILADVGGLGNPARWPSEPAIELLSFDPLDRGDHRAAVERFAEHGRRLTVLQPMLGPFLLRPAQGESLYPGRLGGRPTLFGFDHDHEIVVFAVFDEDGHLLESWEEPDPGPDWEDEEYLFWLETRGFRSEPVRMRPFDGAGRMSLEMYHDQPNRSEPPEVWDWVQQRKYVINWWDPLWANGRTGEKATS